MGYYKNLTTSTLNISLFGVGNVHIPASAKCIELEDSVARAINDMARPNVILEKVTPKIVAEDPPVASPKTVSKPRVVKAPVKGA